MEIKMMPLISIQRFQMSSSLFVSRVCLISGFLCLFLTACTPEPETAVFPTPTATTLAAVTAVPTPANTPTPTSSVSANPATATFAPATTTPTAMTLREFLTNLQNKLNAHDFEALKGMMPAEFIVGEHPNQRQNPASANAIAFLAYRFVPQVDPEIVIHEENILPDLDELFAVETIFGEGQTITAVVASSGWGEGGQAEMILYIARQDDQYRWAGLLTAPHYHIVPELETIAPPAGLIYRQGNDLWNDLWRVNQANELEFMTTFSGALSFNPSGTLALYAATEAHQLTLLHLPEGVTETIAIEGTLLHGSWQMPWLDEETAVLIIGAPNEVVTPASTGNLAVLNVLDGTVTTYPTVLSIYSQPSTGNGGVLYNGENGLRLWRDGNEHIVDFDQSLAFADTEREVTLYAPVMSPDGRYMIGVHGGEYGRYTFAYVLADLTNHTSTFLHFVSPVATDAIPILPWGIHWSPNSQWIALAPQTRVLLENSIQIIPVANPSEKTVLMGTTHQPFWLDNEHLVFRRIIETGPRWSYLDLATGEQFWLDLPDGAEVLHYVPPN